MRSWFAAYAAETHADPTMKLTLRDSLGMCPAHTRRLLDEGIAASWLATALFADISRTGARLLRSGGAPPGGRCPPCVASGRRASGMLHLVRTGLDESEHVRDAYTAGPGACVAHTRQLLAGASARVAALVIDVLGARLSAATTEALVGVDADSDRRDQSWSENHDAVLAAEERAAKLSTAAYVDMMLETPACPLCTARVRSTWRYLGWLAGITKPAELRQDAVLCPTHLTDLATVGGEDVAARFAAYNADRTADDLSRAADRLGRLPGTFAGRVAHLVSDRAVRDALVPAFRGAPCRTCHFADQAEGSALRLARITAADPARSGDLAEAHGLCLRHALRLSGRGELDAAWHALATTRLRLLSYDLDTAIQHAGWDSRWQVHGAEMGAWHHAADLLDGEVLGPRAAQPDEPPRGAW